MMLVYILDGELLRVASLEGGHRNLGCGLISRLAQGQHHLGTRWESISDRGIRIPH